LINDGRSINEVRGESADFDWSQIAPKVTFHMLHVVLSRPFGSLFEFRQVAVIGLVHSHPLRPGFRDARDPDVVTANNLISHRPDKGLRWNFQRSFIWGPRSVWLGGRDPEGKLYRYPP
jgi:hypothetical protein